MDMTGAAQDIQELVHAFAQVSLVVVLSPFHPRKKKGLQIPISSWHNSCTSACNCHQQQTNSFLFFACFPIIVTINNSFLMSVHGFFCF
jgi:hypothetical protein